MGDITSAEVLLDDSGKSKGVAEIVFGRREDAEKAVKEYHEVDEDVFFILPTWLWNFSYSFCFIVVVAIMQPQAEVDGRPMSVKVVGVYKPTVVHAPAPASAPAPSAPLSGKQAFFGTQLQGNRGYDGARRTVGRGGRGRGRGTYRLD